MDNLTNAIKQQAKELHEFLANDALDIIEVEGINHIETAFDNEGFTDTSLQPWQKRKTIDKQGRSITRHRSNRHGKQGQLTKYGRQTKGRAVLTGHNTGGNKLRQSYQGNKVSGGITFSTDKPYAQRHNEGDATMPKRQHIGESATLDKNIHRKIEHQLDKIFK